MHDLMLDLEEPVLSGVLPCLSSIISNGSSSLMTRSRVIVPRSNKSSLRDVGASSAELLTREKSFPRKRLHVASADSSLPYDSPNCSVILIIYSNKNF